METVEKVDTVGRYQIEAILSGTNTGMMGITYKAYDPLLDRFVVLKVFSKDKKKRTELEKGYEPEPIEIAEKRFFDQARAMARLSHRGIARVYDAGDDEEMIYIVMEYVEGKLLSEIISDKRISVDEKVSLCAEVADALNYAHNNNVVHRDIKPDNIIVKTDDNSVVILDFGIALFTDSSEKITMAGIVLGTVYYMSPEHIGNEEDVGRIDGRSDLFSLGVILYEAATGKWAFGNYNNRNHTRNFGAILLKNPIPPDNVNAQISPELSNVIMKSLEKKFFDRYQNGEEMKNALLASLKHRPASMNSSKVPNLTEQPAKETLIKSPVEVSSSGHPANQTSADPTTDVPPENEAAIIENEQPTVSIIKKKPSTITQRLRSQKKHLLLGMLLLSAIIILAVNLPITGTASKRPVRIGSEPEDAIVLIDAEKHGSTPMALDLKYGNYNIRLEKEGYLHWEKDIVINEQSDQIIELFAGLEERDYIPIRLKLSSRPKDATVFVDSKRGGATPIELALEYGDYAIRLEKGGYLPWEKNIVINEKSEKIVSLFANLEEIIHEKQVNIRSKPEDAIVFINSKRHGTTPIEVALEFGNYKILLEKEDYLPWEKDIVINGKSEDIVHLTANLEKIKHTSQISIRSEPKGAIVFINSEKYGKTPMDLELEYGNYTIRLEKKGYFSWNKDIVINQKSERKISLSYRFTEKF